MSRVGKNIIQIPNGVTVDISGANVTVKGPKGELKCNLPESIALKVEDKSITVQPQNKEKLTLMLYGTTQRNVQNMVTGVSEGFKKLVNLVGVGYRANVQGNVLVLQLGYSHDINFEIPAGISVAVDKTTAITVSGSDKQLIGQVVAKLKSYRKPEPYKGKGVIPEGYFILKKEGKKK